MKKFTMFLGALALMVLTVASAQAQSLRTFAGTSTDIGATNSNYIIPATGQGPSRVTYLHATSDKAGSVVQFYKALNGAVLITATGASGQAVITAVGTGNFTAGDRVVVQHLSADSYEMLTVSSVTATNVTAVQNLSAAVASGDKVYKMTAAGQIPVGNATKEVINSGGIYNSTVGLPVLVELDGTSACQINVISGVFDPLK